MDIHKYAAAGDVDAVRSELAKGCPVDLRDEGNNTPLACAVMRGPAPLDIVRLLINEGGDVNAKVGNRAEGVLSIAARCGHLEACELLLGAGADVNSATDKGYTPLINSVFGLYGSDRLIPMIDLLLRHGADVDHATDYQESPVSVALRLNRFDALRFLLDQGADPTPLEWTNLARAVAIGTVADVAARLASEGLTTEPDRFGRTPGLLAAISGSLEKGQLLADYGWDVNETGSMPESALIACAEQDHAEMLAWLIEQGAVLDLVDDWDGTALTHAAAHGSARCVELLLKAGANPRTTNDPDHSAMARASTVEIVRLLQQAGQDVTEANTKTRRLLVGLPSDPTIDCSPQEYARGKTRQFGRRNPERMEIPFWRTMVRMGCGAFQARRQFNDTQQLDEPVWCFDRFGSSFTELPDGRFVQIAGEHEDYYDPDFCIYNDVVVFTGAGEFQIYGYPEDIFPPTDFHTATYWEGSIYLIGSLGYAGTRQYGQTPVYRLSCRDWSIEKINTSGSPPGWIYKHTARLEPPNRIVVSGGTVVTHSSGQDSLDPLEGIYALDLVTRKWERTE